MLPRSLVLFTTRLALLAPLALGAPLAPARNLTREQTRTAEKVAPMLATPESARAAAAKLGALDEKELASTTDALALAIVTRKAYDQAATLHDALLARGDLRSALVAATVLLRTVEALPESPFGVSPEVRAFPDSLCERAAALLDHPNPVVQGLADWTLALRVKKHDSITREVAEMYCRSAKPPKWYATWKTRDARLALRDDYVRQLVQFDRQLGPGGLAAAVDDVEKTLRKVLADPASRPDPATAQQFEKSLAVARAACAPGSDLGAAHNAYLALRRAARAVVAGARPDFPREGVVYETCSRVPGGDWNVNVPVTAQINTPSGDIYVKRSADPEAAPQALIKGRLGDGSFRGLDLIWEADRVLFSFWSQPIGKQFTPNGWDSTKNAGVHEVVLATGELRTITNPEGYNDIEPCYLPDGGYVFSSDRSSYGNQCAGSILQNKRCTTLFRVDPRRSPDPVAISNNKDFDRHSSVLNDGTVVFLHWEYQERGLYSSHNVWRCRPDGTNMDAYFKQHISSPYSIRGVRQAPDSELHVATAQGHHNGPNGPVIVFNPSLGINNEQAMWLLTPGCTAIEGGEGALAKQIVPEGGVPNRGGSYINPFPVSAKAFLVGHDMSESAADFAIYYIDVWGNRELVQRDRDLSCFQPMALRPRKRPPVVADTVKPEATFATAFLEDVYRDLPGVKRGEVKYLRMSQSLMLPAPVYSDEERTPGSTRDYNHLHYLPGDATARHFAHWQWAPSRMIGLVKVEDDGSAYFKVPAGTPVYLQALDENFTEVRRMRTSFTLQRGEFRSCTGCHESRLETVGNRKPLPKLTLAKGAQTPVPPPWGDTTVLDYEKHIQPIFDRNCVSCHGKDSPAGGLDFTARRIGGFAQSYRTIFGLKPGDPTPINEIDWHLVLNPDAKGAAYLPKEKAQKALIDIQANQWPGQLVMISNRQDLSTITQPRQFGSGVSKLVRTLLDEPKHRDGVRAKMSAEDWLMLVTWVDYNAIYNGTLFDVSRYQQTKTFNRVAFDLPSVWIPADVNPSFYNHAKTQPSGSAGAH